MRKADFAILNNISSIYSLQGKQKVLAVIIVSISNI